MEGRQRALVPRGQRAQQVQRLASAHLAAHDAVGSHPQRVADERPDRDCAAPLERRRTALEPDDADIVDTLNDYAEMLRKAGRVREALELEARAEALQKEGG